MENNIKCEDCDHSTVCYLYLNHIKAIEREGIKLNITKCPEYKDV